MSANPWRREQAEEVTRLARQLQRASYCRVVVPSKTSTSRLLSLDLWTNRILDVVLPLTRGATEMDARGYWLDGNESRVSEAVRLLDVYLFKRLSPAASRLLVEHFELWADLMSQEALAVVIGQRMHLVYPHARPVVLRDTESRKRFLREVATQNVTGVTRVRGSSRQRSE